MEIVIEFLRENKTYYPGETVAGKLLISKNTETPIEGLYVRLEGKRFANVNPNVNYPEEFYFCEESRQAESSTVLQAGKHEYPFLFTLPTSIPASIEVSRASVEYQIIVTLKVLCEFDKIVRTKFYVDGLLNLEHDPSSAESREVKKHKSVGFLCKGGHFGVLLKVERLGYLPGDYVSFIADINNATSMDLQVKLFLVRELHFLDGGNFKKILSEYGTLYEIVGPLVRPGEDKIWRGDVFKIPKVPPTHLGCRRLIELNYFLKIDVAPVRLMQRHMEAKVPLIIGSPITSTLKKVFPPASPLISSVQSKPADNQMDPSKVFPPVGVLDENVTVTVVDTKKMPPIRGITMNNCIVLEANEEDEPET